MANVEILKVGRALIAGERGEGGGAPSKDSIWGVATVQGNVVKFYGRRVLKDGKLVGVLRYKTARKADLPQVLDQFEIKKAGKDKGFGYDELTVEQQAELVPGLAEVVKVGYYKAMGNGKLNTRATKSPAKTVKAPKAEKTEKAAEAGMAPQIEQIAATVKPAAEKPACAATGAFGAMAAALV